MAELSHGLVIFLVILGCVVATLIGYVIHYTLTNGFYNSRDNQEISEDQKHYMKFVRLQNQQWLVQGAPGKIPTRHG